MAKKRTRPVVNPLLKDRVGAIVGPTITKDPQLNINTPDEPRSRLSQTNTPYRTEQTRRKGRGDIQIKARFSRAEVDEIERFTRTLSSYLRTTVKGSEVTRALWTLAIRSQDQLAVLSHKAPNMDRPSYGDRFARAEFEDAIANFLLLTMNNE